MQLHNNLMLSTKTYDKWWKLYTPIFYLNIPTNMKKYVKLKQHYYNENIWNIIGINKDKYDNQSDNIPHINFIDMNLNSYWYFWSTIIFSKISKKYEFKINLFDMSALYQSDKIWQFPYEIVK